MALGADLGRGPFVQADATALGFASGSVDVVIASMSLMLLDPLEAAVAELSRVLRPGGSLVAVVPARWPVRLRDVGVVTSLTYHLGPGWAPPHLEARRLHRRLAAAGLSPGPAERVRFGFRIATAHDAALVVRSLYTPGRSAGRLAAAEHALARRAGPRTELPVPLTRIVATRYRSGP